MGMRRDVMITDDRCEVYYISHVVVRQSAGMAYSNFFRIRKVEIDDVNFLRHKRKIKNKRRS